jgi:hypothetical protein
MTADRIISQRNRIDSILSIRTIELLPTMLRLHHLVAGCSQAKDFGTSLTNVTNVLDMRLNCNWMSVDLEFFR